MLQSRNNCLSPFQPRIVFPGNRGHPHFLIPREQLVGLREIVSWSKIGQLIGISHRTTFNRRVQLNIDDPREYSSISDSDLDREVIAFKTNIPNIGVRLL